MFRVRRRTVLVVALAGTLALATFAFTASNTVPGSKAGKGEGVISGYAVSSVAYTLSSTNPANIDSVAFTLDAAAATVKAKLVASSSAYTDCSVAGLNVTCNFSPDVAVLSADELSVVAVS
jgi:hypothetical protein